MKSEYRELNIQIQWVALHSMSCFVIFWCAEAFTVRPEGGQPVHASTGRRYALKRDRVVLADVQCNSGTRGVHADLPLTRERPTAW